MQIKKNIIKRELLEGMFPAGESKSTIVLLNRPIVRLLHVQSPFIIGVFESSALRRSTRLEVKRFRFTAPRG